MSLKEIERKFLVISDAYENLAVEKIAITQGFLNADPDRTVRIRRTNDKGFITVKGLSSSDGLSRFEWEKEISATDAMALLQLCLKPLIRKTRYRIPWYGLVIEVDVFDGDNEGLVLAEVELLSESETFEKPQWLGDEVTGDLRYYNANLFQNPYKSW